MEEKIVIVSDIHANWPAFRAVLADMKKLGPFTGKYCLGDTVGYGPFPNECVEAVRSEGFESVLGNHDRAVRGGDYDFNSDASLAVEYNIDVLNGKSLDYLRGLSNKPFFDPRERFGLVHGSFASNAHGFVSDNCGATEFEDIYVLHEEDAYRAMAGMQYKEGDDWVSVPIGFVGHTHFPMMARATMRFKDGEVTHLQRRGMSVKTIGDYRNRTIDLEFMPPAESEDLPKILVNFGSVGQPRHGSPDACYGIATFRDDGSVHFQYRSVPYPVEETQRKMREEKFPKKLINRLAVGN